MLDDTKARNRLLLYTLVRLGGLAIFFLGIAIIYTDLVRPGGWPQVGAIVAIILFLLRVVQGLCLGGEYGGAITYVAEHIEDKHRGYYTGWLQTSPTLGIVVSLFVIIATRTYFGNEVFDAWAWRIPFLISFLLVAIAIYIRLQLQETPIFQDIKARGQMTKNPWKEAFLSSNIKFVLIACIVLIGQGVVWYSGQFWALYFLQQVSKVDPLTTAYIVMAGLLIGKPVGVVALTWFAEKVLRLEKPAGKPDGYHVLVPGRPAPSCRELDAVERSERLALQTRDELRAEPAGLDAHHVEAAGHLPHALGLEIAVRELAQAVLLSGAHARLGALGGLLGARPVAREGVL